MKRVIFALGVLLVFACSKTEVPAIPPVVVIQEEAIKFTTNLDTGTYNVADTLPLVVSVSSKLPSAGILYSILVNWTDSSKQIFKLDTSLNVSSLSLNIPGLKKTGSYSLSVTVTSKSTSTNTLNKSISVINSFLRKFLSFSPKYNYPNNTVGQVKNGYYFPGYFLSNDSLKSKYGINFWSDYAYFDPAKVYGDFDGDGFLDLFFFQIKSSTVLWASENGRYVYINNALSKNPKITYYNSNTNWMPNFEVNDFNGDGKLDILQYTWNSHQLSDGKTKSNPIPLKIIYFNSNQIEIKDIGLPIDVHDASTGDIDNDGDLDILAWDYILNSGPILYKNDGNGNFIVTNQNETFKGLSDIRIPNHSYQMTAIELIDLNNDNKLDIVRGNLFNFDGISDFTIYWGNSNGTFELIKNVTYVNNEVISSDKNTILGFNFFDYDKDGDLDIFCISTLNYTGFDINVFENKGNNIFKDVTKKIIDVFSAKNTFPNFYNIRFYDIDNDGDYDMVPDQIANWEGFKYSSKLFWENVNGNFLIKNF